jgi:uncharacterized protein
MSIFGLIFATFLSFSAFANSPKEQSLFDAIKAGDVQLTTNLVESGVNPNIHNENGRTPLIEAVFFWGNDRESIILNLSKILVAHGANVNADTAGWTALNMAANYGYLGVVQYLISEGANVNAMDALCGRSVLWLAAYAGYDQIVSELLNHTVEINQRSCDGFTPLGIAKKQNFLSVADILKSHGGIE